MGFWGELLDGVGEVLAESARPLVGNSDTYYDYTSYVSGTITKDSQYMKIFSDALKYICKNRQADSYVQRLLKLSYGTGNPRVATLENGPNVIEDYAVWHICYKDSDNPNDWMWLRLRTPNAIQKNRNGKSFTKNNSAYFDAYVVESDAIACHRKRLAEQPRLKSFLGVKFGDDASKYVVECKPKDLGDGSVLMHAKANSFLDFNHYRVMVSKFSNKIVGVMCLQRKSEVVDVEEYMNRIVELLEQKYSIERCEIDNEYLSSLYDDSGWNRHSIGKGIIFNLLLSCHSRHLIPFYDASEWNPQDAGSGVVAHIVLSSNDKFLYLFAQDIILCSEMKKEADKKAEEDLKRANQNAVDAL